MVEAAGGFRFFTSVQEVVKKIILKILLILSNSHKPSGQADCLPREIALIISLGHFITSVPEVMKKKIILLILLILLILSNVISIQR